MKCRKARSLLSLRLDGRLTYEEEHQLSEHLEICASCASEYRGLEKTVAWVRSLPEVPASEGFTQDVLLSVRRSRRANVAPPVASIWERFQEILPLRSWSFSPGLAFATLAVGLIVGITGSMVAFRSPDTVTMVERSSLAVPSQVEEPGALSPGAIEGSGPAREFEDLVQEMLRRVEAEETGDGNVSDAPSLDWEAATDLDALGRQVGSRSGSEEERAGRERVTVVF